MKKIFKLEKEPENGITLIVLFIVVIVLFILAGITLVIGHQYILQKTAEASTRTVEAYLKEQLEMVFSQSEMDYQIAKKDNQELDKISFVKEKVKVYLAKQENTQNVSVELQGEKYIISYQYRNQEYHFTKKPDGRINLICSLKGNVEIGDYVSYPIEYTDISSGKKYTSENGWKVLDDGVSSGSSGKVKLISSGIPAKWLYVANSDNSTVINELLNNFSNVIIDTKTQKNVTGQIFEKAGISNKVSVLQLSELNMACNKVNSQNRNLNDISSIGSSDKLFYINNYLASYWVISPENNKVYFLLKGNFTDNDQANRSGIRTVIYLEDSLMCYKNSNIWKIDN